MIPNDSCLLIFYCFLCAGKTLAIFEVLGKIPCLSQLLNSKQSGLIAYDPHILRVLVEIL